MSLLIALIIGGFVGWLAGQVMGRDEGVFASVIIGIIGSIIGSALSTLLGGSGASISTLSWSGIFWSFLGAVILVALLNAFQGRTHHHI